MVQRPGAEVLPAAARRHATVSTKNVGPRAFAFWEVFEVPNIHGTSTHQSQASPACCAASFLAPWFGWETRNQTEGKRSGRGQRSGKTKLVRASWPRHLGDETLEQPRVHQDIQTAKYLLNFNCLLNPSNVITYHPFKKMKHISQLHLLWSTVWVCMQVIYKQFYSTVHNPFVVGQGGRFGSKSELPEKVNIQ